jgi:hypothetical protein
MNNDGQIRLTYDGLQDLDLVHLISGLDEDGPPLSNEGAVQTAITGYTEWVTHSPPRVTLGWDWQMLAAPNQVELLRVGEPRSNLMLQNGAGGDMGHEKSSMLLETFIDAFDWQSETLSSVSTRYAADADATQNSAACQR